MSDDANGGISGIWGANAGVSLPGDSNATYNINLLPLSWSATGHSRTLEQDFGIDGRGDNGFFWSSNVYSTTYSYFFSTARYATRPSAFDYRAFTFSLRCLISTNNG